MTHPPAGPQGALAGGRRTPPVASRKARGTSVRDALEGAITALAAGGCETPRLDAEVLLAHVLGVSRGSLAAAGGGGEESELRVHGAAVRAFQEAVRRRSIEREPVAYIVGRRAFRHLELRVDRRALIPRPESELLVEVALGLEPGAHVLDLGTGCGAVALALKHERPDLQLSASDVSTQALELAALNGRELALEVRWLRADLLDGLADEFDVILANLPYVAEGERDALAPEIVRHEPQGALFAGTDGLACIRELILQASARACLRLLALELGAGQAGAVGELARAAGFEAIRFDRDLAGIKRVVIAERRRP